MCKNMCILVKYMGSTRKIRLDLLELLELDAKDCSAANVFQLFEACMQKLGVPITNCIALACDNANVMVGAHNSFYSRLKAICPWLILLNCVCHSSAIVSSHDCAKLPPVVKKLMQTTSTFISSSPKRTAELEEFAEFYEEQHNTVKKLSFTRWLVLHPCIVRFLELHRPLVQFFVMADFEDKKKETHANWILSELNNPFTMSYLKFLKYSLEFFNKFNALFQTKDTLIHKLSKSCEVILKQVCQNYVKNEFLPQIATLNLTSPHIQVPLESVYLGPECEAALAEIPLPNDPEKKMTREQLTRKREHDISQFRLRCLDFYVTAAKEIQHTFPIGKPIIKEMEFIDPKIALDENARGLSHLRVLHVLSNHFKDKLQLDPTTVAFEWRTLPGLFDQEQKEALLQMTPDVFWAEIHNSRDFEDNMQCPQLVKLAEAVLIMPHANADAERLFSIVTDTKTKKRNRMKNALLNAICITRTAFRTKNIDSVSLNITEKHLEKHNAAMYDT